MSDDERVLHELFDRIWNAGDEAAVDRLFDPAFRHHDLVTPADTDLAGRWATVGTTRERGRMVRVDGMSFDHVPAGRIVEDWTVWDRGGLARQLSDEFGS